MVLKRAFGYSVGLHVTLVALVGGLRLAPNAHDLTAQTIEISTLSPASSPQKGSTPHPAKRMTTPKAVATPDSPAALSTVEPAKSETAPLATVTSGSGNTVSESASPGTQARAQTTYEQYVRAQIAQRKTYPPLARRLGQTGQVVVKFRVEASGQVTNAEVIHQSPYETLNRDAQKILSALSRLEPIPQELGKSHWDFVIGVDYKLE